MSRRQVARIFAGTRCFSPEQHEKCDVCIRNESSTPCHAVKWHEVCHHREIVPCSRLDNPGFIILAFLDIYMLRWGWLLLSHSRGAEQRVSQVPLKREIMALSRCR